MKMNEEMLRQAKEQHQEKLDTLIAEKCTNAELIMFAVYRRDLNNVYPENKFAIELMKRLDRGAKHE